MLLGSNDNILHSTYFYGIFMENLSKSTFTQRIKFDL